MIFGGFATTKVSVTQNPLYELDLINFEWYIPKTSGKMPVCQFAHQENVVDKYMIISFGKCNFNC